ncbi:hypothetical protein A11A3_13043 [Alcanivorax hongdengensis A-11-3]|uniref:Outer-membrane lipoprotein LolB n=1 Tax=Alcanivorax hongdengensis A-11-3 TaxID=1177179 RepID=L0W9D2_9GAMM|nr:lipoprotein insertase outer membrane protein LolB [Alcanivorax hongdengensis]EKF73556.1 hypothetical protein A11A3_13043 [Alcanivorax hongdengensis A-11-3]
MKALQLGCLLLVYVALQGCSALSRDEFLGVSTEEMTQWYVEGEMTVKSDAGKEHTYFTYKLIDDDYTLSIRPDKRVGDPRALITGSLLNNDNGKVWLADSSDGQARDIVQQVHYNLPLADLGYWLRGLAATGNAEVSRKKTDRVDRIREHGWVLDYHDYIEMGHYLMPGEISMKSDQARADIQVVRGETAYLISPCEATSRADPSASYRYQRPQPDDGARDRVAALVPADGSAPIPKWIDSSDFCDQLKKVHGDVPDPRIGLYGPDSMMWKVVSPLTPAGLGAGRALLLQIAHPWVTAGIDQHSIVRDDPLKRARNTFMYILTMVYGSMPQVMQAANEVRSMHEQVQGEMTTDAGAFAKGSEYRANEVNAMVWVNATLWDTLVRMYEKERGELSDAEKEQFYQESKLFAMLFGLPRSALPETWDDFEAYNKAMWHSDQLTVTDETLKLKNDLFDARSIWMIFPLWAQKQITAANLPPNLREDFEMKYGWWQKFNNAWLMAGAKVTDFILPDSMMMNPAYHEAEARLEGKRAGWYQRAVLRMGLGREQLVN